MNELSVIKAPSVLVAVCVAKSVAAGLRERCVLVLLIGRVVMLMRVDEKVWCSMLLFSLGLPSTEETDKDQPSVMFASGLMELMLSGWLEEAKCNLSQTCWMRQGQPKTWAGVCWTQESK